MSLFVRAAGLSAAILAVAAGVTLAQPSQALDLDPNPLATRYIDHADATNDVATPTTDTIDPAPSTAADFASPVEAHAQAVVAELPVPADTEKKSLSELVVANASADTGDAQQECLAQAVYFESNGEPLEGQLAVAEVIMNRAASGRFPATLCGVVRQKSQFSFVRGGHIPSAPKASAGWRKAVAISQIAMRDLADSKAGKAMFFHAARVSPNWRGRSRVGMIGNHVFYR